MQQPPPTQQQAPPSPLTDFQAGVTAILRSWSALRTAVESGWGGGERESQQKAEVLRQHIFDVLNGGKSRNNSVDVYDLADNLAIYLEEEFSVTLEDNSEQQVAETIFRLYEDCLNGDSALAREVIDRDDEVDEHYHIAYRAILGEMIATFREGRKIPLRVVSSGSE